MNNRSRYIAETDERGTVIWLWELHPGDRMARPVRKLSLLDQRLCDATIEGASLNSVTDWLAREQQRSPIGGRQLSDGANRH
ncbi:hypothetical protein [Loktanella sp. M215]|uniref:hypothetical protein n=1 Tax=Loktanella sp. M215 TaxID=2675431 RepID=UPI001F1F449E|nr:hypothetical protein [Loktanella sp. M215]MCF7702431.1 hypothetical protein [Loktanella sp. M215]